MPNAGPRRAAAAALVVAGLLAAQACTDAEHGSARSAGPSPSPSGTSQPAPAAVPLRVQVTHVAGTLAASRRSAVAVRVRQALSTYLTDGFVGGPYPRSDFSRSFSAFTAGAAAQARHRQGLLTNADLGPTTRSVRLTHAVAYVSVLAPHGHPVGGTAAVAWTFAVDRGERPAQRVHVAGRLLLTPAKAGRWRIFGYDLHRSATRTGAGS